MAWADAPPVGAGSAMGGGRGVCAGGWRLRGMRRPMRFVAEIEGASHKRSFLRIAQFYHLFDKNMQKTPIISNIPNI